MRNIYKRFVAYFIDVLLVYFVVSCLSNISFINPELNKYNSYYDEYRNVYMEYQGFISNLKKYYSDNKISEDEYAKISKKYDNFIKYIDKYYSDGKITKSEYRSINKRVNDGFLSKYKKLYYYINRYSIFYNVIYIVMLCLYFVLFNFITSGETLGKRFMKLKVVGVDDLPVSGLDYFIRFIVLYNPIYYLGLVIGVLCFNVSSFYNFALVLSNIKNYLFIIVVGSAIIRSDNRGLHEILSHTKVVGSKNYSYKRIKK